MGTDTHMHPFKTTKCGLKVEVRRMCVCSVAGYGEQCASREMLWDVTQAVHTEKVSFKSNI